MIDDLDLPEYTDHERQLFRQLPRAAETQIGEETALLLAMRGGGLMASPLAGPPRRRRWPVLAAAGIALFVLGGFAGARVGARANARGSLEGMLARHDLSLADRILLMQRAGSAYVTAAQSYASAAKGVDSMAVQVSSQVLVGAAQAVARSDLDGGLASRLSMVLQRNASPRATRPVIWY